MRLTRRALVIAVLVTVGTAVIWPDGAERVARIALLGVGAAVVADLVLRWQRSYPTEATAPFAPAVRRPVRPWVRAIPWASGANPSWSVIVSTSSRLSPSSWAKSRDRASTLLLRTSSVRR